MKYKVSIIVPVYNVEKYLRECLDSLVNQTLKEIEIICINDASPDNSLKILKEYKKNHPKLIKIIDLKNNVGQGCARNHGLDKAQGEYISFVDSDDYVDVTMCEKLYAFAKKNGADMVQFSCVIFYEKDYKNKDSVFENYNSNCFKGKSLCISKEDFIIESIVMVCMRFYHHSVWNNIRFPNCIYEDVAVTIFTLINSKKILKLKDYLYFYRKRPGSTMTSSPELDFSVLLKVFEFILVESKKRKFVVKYERPIFAFISKFLCGYLFKNTDYPYEKAIKSIYDQDSLLDRHFKKMSKIYPEYLEKIIQFSRPKDRRRLKIFLSHPFLLKCFLYTKFACRRAWSKLLRKDV